MKRKKLICTLLVAVIAFAAFFAGCGSSDAQKTATASTAAGSTNEPAASTAAPAEKMSLSVLVGTNWPLPTDVDPNSNRWADVFKKALPDININWIIVPAATLMDKRNLMMGSGDMPDMLAASQGDMLQWADSGLIIPLDEQINKYYTVKDSYFSKDSWKMVTYKDKIWAIITPHSPYENPSTLFVRKDWLDNLGLQMPATIDDFYNDCKAFTTQDPDKNGKNDTFGLASLANLGYLSSIFLAYGVNPNEGFWSMVDGKLMPDSVRPETKDALAFMKKLYVDGYYDKDSLALQFSQLEEKATSGKEGFFVFPSAGVAARVNVNLKKQNSNAEFVTCEPPKGPNGYQGISIGTDVANILVVTAKCQYPEAAVKLINWMLEKDTTKNYNAINADIIGCGDIGVHSDLINDKWPISKPDALLSDEAKKDIYRRSYWFLTMGIIQVASKDDILEFHKAYVDKMGLTQNYYTDSLMASQYGVQTKRLVAGPMSAKYEAQLGTYFDEIKMKIVTGKSPIDSFDQWVDYYMKNGGTEIIQEANDMNK